MLPTTKDQYDAYVELSFKRSTVLIPMVRRFVSEFFAQVLGDPALVSRVCLAAHELLENAVSYAADGLTSISIGVRRLEDALDVAIDTQNRASVADTSMLQSRLDEMAAAGDPATHYLTLMRRSAARAEGSGLGLGRICAEADMSLACQIDLDTVRVQARAHYPAVTPTG
jgi:hypothetical protein